MQQYSKEIYVKEGSKRKCLPKLTPEYRAALRRLSKAFKRSRQPDASDADTETYRAARRAAREQYRKDDSARLRAELDNAGPRSTKAYWRVIDDRMGKNQGDRSEPRCSPNALNMAPIRKVARIREPLLKHPLSPLPRTMPPTIDTVREFTASEVLEVLKDIRPTPSSGEDEIPMKVLLAVAPHIQTEIAALANACVKAECWPTEWNDARIAPLWTKKGSRDDPNMYRPISLLPAISRVVERSLQRRLKEHIRNHPSILPHTRLPRGTQLHNGSGRYCAAHCRIAGPGSRW